MLQNIFDFSLDYYENYEKYVRQAADFIKKQLGNFQPQFGLTLGSGLGDLAQALEDAQMIEYKSIPHFPKSTTAGHAGRLLAGKLQGVNVLCFQGRKHYYEDAHLPLNVGLLEAVFAVHVLAELGATHYFSTNASGGLNLNYQVGDIMIIRSHINTIPNACLGPVRDFKRIDNHEALWRFQPMNNAYDQKLRALLKQACPNQKNIHEGVYLGLTGTTYETEAECIAFRDSFKADAVGMSTTPEIITARHRGLTCVGMSCITNTIMADGTNATNHEEVKAILESSAVRTRLSTTVQNFFKSFQKNYQN